MSRRIFATAVVALSCAGCSHIITTDTPYYVDGPEQLDPPQGDVKKGTWCLVVGERGGYYHVWTSDGVNAFVWGNAVAPLLEFRRQEKERADEAERQKRLQRAGLNPTAVPPPTAQPPASQPGSPPGRL